jgi:hypothetical protein
MKKIFIVFLLVLTTVSLFALDGVVIGVLGKVEKQSGSRPAGIRQRII